MMVLFYVPKQLDPVLYFVFWMFTDQTCAVSTQM